MGRSKSPSHSSRSNSRSHSSARSRSQPRRKRYSSRSRSRTYSRSRSRERVYNRDFRRDYRNNRGIRSPYGFRGRTRGYYQGGGRYYRGGYRPMWNRRYSRSPRRDRSRSRSPKRRSVSSPRSRSRSRRSYKSSPSQRSSSSHSSSQYSKSPVIKIHTTQDKQGQKTESYNQSESPPNKSSDEQKDAFDPSEPLDELGSRSAFPVITVVRCTKDTLSQNIHSIDHSPEISASRGNGSNRYSPSQNSPLQIIPCKSPAKSVLTQNPLEESHSRYSFYADATEEHTNDTKFFNRFTDEENKLFPIEKSANKEKGTCKEKATDKTKKGGSIVWDEQVALDYFLEKEPGNSQFLTNSESDDLEEPEDYRQFRKSVLADQGKGLSSVSSWNYEEEDSKYKTKGLTRVSKEGEKFKDIKGSKSGEQIAKEKHKVAQSHTIKKVAQRHTIKKDTLSPDQLKLEKTKDIFSYSLSLHSSNVKEKIIFREESPVRMRIVATESLLPEVKLRIITVPLDDCRAPCLDDRLLGSTLIHSVKKVQDFRTIFDHLKVSFTSKTSPESYMNHVVSLVHHVKEHYFKGCGKTLNERFTDYQKETVDHVSHLKRPEIHRVIDIFPYIPKYRMEDEDKAIKKETAKVEKKQKSSLSDQRGEVHRKKEHGKERVDLASSRESSSSQKKEKTQKEFKEFKIFKEECKRKKDLEPPHSPSSGEEKDLTKVSEEEFKDPPETKEYPGYTGIGRSRGTLFRIRGRGRARGVFAGASTGTVNTNTTFQKRPKEEEWDPEYTPKSKKYFLHDDRDDGVDYWAKRGRSRGNFQRGRSRFPFKKSGSSPKWTHDKYQMDEHLEDEDETMEDRNKEEKD